MKRSGRGLTPEEAALWARVAKTVKPIEGRKIPPPAGEGDHAQHGGTARTEGVAPRHSRQQAVPLHQPAVGSPPLKGEELRPRTHHGLDGSWDRKLARGIVHPDFTLDLHGSSLDAAHGRLDHGLTLALAQGARVVLLITGRDRPSEARRSRGAIRRKFLDWLMAGPHASKIAAIRPAHPRHGGAGAVYLVLRKGR